MDMEMVMVKGQLERQDLTQLAFVNFWHRKLRAREVPGDQMLAAKLKIGTNRYNNLAVEF